MKKITILLSLVASVVLMTACDAKKNNPAQEETAGEKREYKGIAQQVIDDALSRVQDADADVEDVAPMIMEAYNSEDGDIWIFFEDEGTLEAALYPVEKGAEPTWCRLSKRGPAAYDAYPGERAEAMCVLRVKEGGDIVEMTEGSKVTIFKKSDLAFRDMKARIEEEFKAQEQEEEE